MKRIVYQLIIILSFMYLIYFVSGFGGTGGEIPDGLTLTSHDIYSIYTLGDSFNSHLYVGQVFPIGYNGSDRDGYLEGLGFFYQQDSGNGNVVGDFLNVSIYTVDSSFKPSSVVDYNYTVNVSETNSTPSLKKSWWINVTFNNNQILRNNTNYTLVLTYQNSSAAATPGVNMSYAQNNFPLGRYCTSSDFGTAWDCGDSTSNMLFYLYTNSTIPPPVSEVLLEAPSNNTHNSSLSQNFTCSADTIVDNNIQNVTFYLWDIDNTNIQNISFADVSGAASGTANQSFYVTSINESSYWWNCLYQNLTGSLLLDSNYTYTVDTISPDVNITNVLYLYNNASVPVNYTLNESNYDTCAYSIDGGTTNTSFGTCGTNATITANQGDNTLFVYVSDLAGNRDFDSKNFTVLTIHDLRNSTNATETATEDFSMVLLNGTSTLISAVLRYNNTDYTYDSLTSNSSTFFINRSIQYPLIDTPTLQINWTWNTTFQRETDFVNVTTFGSQTIRRMNFHFCNSTYPTTYLNFTFKDETTDGNVFGQFNPARFYYGASSNLLLNRSLSYTNITDRASYEFCYGFSNDTITVQMDLDYLNSSAPQRNFVNTTTLSNDTTNKVLYLLATADGIYVAFIVINQADQPLQSVSVTAEREIDGTFETVETGLTDDSGTVTFFLNPNKAHRMTFEKSGYDDVITTITPTQSQYFITMGSAAVSNETNYYQGIKYIIDPQRDVLANHTNYTFNFNITSSYFALTSSGFTLSNLSGTQLGTSTCTTDVGCNSSLTIGSGNETNIRMSFFWITSGNVTNGTKVWTVSSTKAFVSSWDKFKSDFEKFGASFGTGTNADFTKAIIAFFIILALTASVSFFAGVHSPLSIVGMVAIGTAFFDTLGWMPSPLFRAEPIPYFTTIIMGLIFIAMLIPEYRK